MRRVCLVLVLGSLSGCSDDSTGPEVGDAAVDAGFDASVRDGGSDAQALDATAQPTSDAQVDARVDAALDASATTCVPFTMPSNCSVPPGAVLPGELRCTGLYGDPTSKALACGVEAYAPAFQLWSDGAEKHRYIALPPGTSIDVSDPDDWVFPVGTKLWKEFQVELAGVRKRGETRLLQKSADGWLYTTYVWSEDESQALQQNEGVADLFGSGHTVPTRDQCRSCHEGRIDFALGWDFLMLGPGASGLTREVLSARGLLGASPDPALLASVVPGNELERAALGYLHANCGVSCHNETAAAAARDTGLMMRLERAQLGSATQAAVVQTGANRLPGPNSKLPPGGPYYDLLPGDAAHSLLVARMSVRGTEAQMPRLGTNRVDAVGVDTITRWIDAMGAEYPAPAPVDGGLVASDDDGGTPDAGAIEVDAGQPMPDASMPPAPACASAPDTSGLGYQIVMTDNRLTNATFATQAPGSDDWYVVDMVGAIWQAQNGVLGASPFLDLRDTVLLGAGFDQTTITYDERGLVGLAFAPDYASSGLFYVALTPSLFNFRGLEVNHDYVLEFRMVNGAPALQRKLVDLPSSSSTLGNIHNINTVRFGPDGFLYVGSGDGGGVRCNDAENGAAQNIGRPFGKLLRLDPKAAAPHAAAGNPFAGSGDARVFHYGLRNPFRFSFDRATGDLYLGDVGQDSYEEIDYAPASASGLNFGWPTYEGNAGCPGNTTGIGGPSAATAPIVVMDRRSFAATGVFSDYRAVTGGIVYRGAALPKLQGAYLFGDYYGRRLGALRQCASATSPIAVLAKVCDPNQPSESCLPTPAGAARFASLTAIVEDHAGELYFVANGNSLLRLIPR